VQYYSPDLDDLQVKGHSEAAKRWQAKCLAVEIQRNDLEDELELLRAQHKLLPVEPSSQQQTYVS
jgi:hypothetical protein